MISIIFPCYWVTPEHVAMTVRCVLSMNETGKPDEVILVDDGSPLSPGEVPEFISRPVNGGYAAAVNTGLAAAKGNILIICNNDIVFIQPRWLDHLIKPLNEGYGISSIRTTDADGWTVEDKITEGDKFGSIWALKREVYEKIGPLDDSFGKGYFEDLDYQKRAEDDGFKVAKNHAGLVEHVGKATFKEIDPDDKVYQGAMKKFVKKWGKVW